MRLFNPNHFNYLKQLYMFGCLFAHHAFGGFYRLYPPRSPSTGFCSTYGQNIAAYPAMPGSDIRLLALDGGGVRRVH
jgi:hypothetical protein